MTQKLVLASTSTARQMLLARLKIPFEIVASNVDETPLENETPLALVERLAKEKARAVAKNYPDAVIIGADQVGVIDNMILCKPLTKENAIAQLQQISGKRVSFLIGLCVINTKTKHEQAVVETFDVFFRKLTSSMIQHYLDREDVLSCAGSVKGEGLGIALVEKFSSGDFSALIGLPLIRLIAMLEETGFAVL